MICRKHRTLSALISLIWASTYPHLLHQANAYSTPTNHKASAFNSHKLASSPSSTAANESTAATASTRKPLIPPVIQKGLSTLALTGAITVSTAIGGTLLPTAHAADLDLNGDDTVEIVLQNLKDSTGDATKSFQVFESISDIIKEGTGVGGSLSYNGVKLDRGYVADEDTAIYNPGLSLLTESEKSSLVTAIIQNKKGNIAAKTWSEDNEYAYDFLKTKLDPLHMVELAPFLKALPFLGGALYLVALAVQQLARELFEVAYVVSALVIFIPIIGLIAAGV